MNDPTMDRDRNASSPPLPVLLRYEDVEKEYGINRNTLYALVRQGRIPHKRFGPRFIRFVRAELDEWIAAHSVDAEGRR